MHVSFSQLLSLSLSPASVQLLYRNEVSQGGNRTNVHTHTHTRKSIINIQVHTTKQQAPTQRMDGRS